MSFVPLAVIDGNGNEWRPKQFQKERRPVVSKDRNWFGGFTVNGFTQELLDSAKHKHDMHSAALVANDKEPLPPFDADAYMRSTKPPKLNVKPFAIESAARQYADLQTKAGRRSVGVFKLTKDGAVAV